MIHSNIFVFLECGNWAANNLNAIQNTQIIASKLEILRAPARLCSLFLLHFWYPRRIKPCPFFLIACLSLSLTHLHIYLCLVHHNFVADFLVIPRILFTGFFFFNYYFPYLQFNPFSVHLEQNCWIHLPIGM